MKKPLSKPKAKEAKATRSSRARVDGKPGKPNDVAWHPAFVESLSRVPDVTDAAEFAGVSTKTAYEHRAKFPDFADDWANALRTANDTAVGELYRRGVIGWDEPVYQGGELVGTIRRKSDQALLFLLKAHLPEIYGDKSKVEHSGKVALSEEQELKLGSEALASITATIRHAAMQGKTVMRET